VDPHGFEGYSNQTQANDCFNAGYLKMEVKVPDSS
ncbi:hypothetical protein Tco_0910563, partial [Tanacetum coccineum]